MVLPLTWCSRPEKLDNAFLWRKSTCILRYCDSSSTDAPCRMTSNTTNRYVVLPSSVSSTSAVQLRFHGNCYYAITRLATWSLIIQQVFVSTKRRRCFSDDRFETDLTRPSLPLPCRLFQSGHPKCHFPGNPRLCLCRLLALSLPLAFTRIRTYQHRQPSTQRHRPNRLCRACQLHHQHHQ